MFKIENIDHAIEWALRDIFIAMGLWPPQRTFIENDDEAGFQAALAAMAVRVDVFGVGNYTDRSQLKNNNVIITRTDISNGDLGISYPIQYVLKPNGKYKKVMTPEGSSHISYQVRFVCYDVDLDRRMNSAIISALGIRKYIHGVNDDLTNMSDGFYAFRIGTPVDMSDAKFIERIFQFQVKDVFLEEQEIILADDISPATDLSFIMNAENPGADVQYPDDRKDIALPRYGVVDFFKGLMEGLPVWQKLEMVRMYAQESEALAIKNLRHGPDAVNSGLSFTPLKGFYRDVDNEYLDTQFSPSNSDAYQLTNYCYMVFVTEAPAANLMELFGLIDNGNSVSLFIRGNDSVGIEAKGNSDDLLSNINLKVKSNTLYTLNRRDRYVLEIYEGDTVIMSLKEEPTFIPNGNVFDLNISDDDGNAVGVGTTGGLAFSAAGPGLRGSEIRQINTAVRLYLTRIGLLSA